MNGDEFGSGGGWDGWGGMGGCMCDRNEVRTWVEGAVVDDVGVDEGQGQVGDAAEAGVGENEAGDLGGDDLCVYVFI